jgi:A/G-specific adenine glycosylase
LSPQIQLKLWFEKNKRDLPFRTKPSAYKIWVSEVMLQQTRVAAMLPLYNQFLLRFPDMDTLSQASEEEVLEHWRGLGYYTRARNLHRACRVVTSRYNGRFPETLEEALEIPGVGPYTARAILSMAYGKIYAVLDGNVKRVISRIFTELDEKKWQGLADLFLNREDPGSHNQAMMELGAMVCLPKPICSNCPIQTHCKAYQEKKIENYPPLKIKQLKLSIELHFYLVYKRDKILLLKDHSRRFFKKLFTLPYIIESSSIPKKEEKNYSNPSYMHELIQTLKPEQVPGQTSHSITHHKIQIFLHKCSQNMSEDFSVLQGFEKKWIPLERLEMEFPSSISKKLLKFIPSDGLFNP